MAITELAEGRPGLVFDMFKQGIRGGKLMVREVKSFFGEETYDKFRQAWKRGEDISEELCLGVDRAQYDKVGAMFGIKDNQDERERFWKTAVRRATDTVNYAHGILFADQERQATLTNNIAWARGKPSDALRVLTMPSGLIGQQYRYEQGSQLGLALLCAELMSRDENGQAREVLAGINTFLERRLFTGKSGDPKKYHTFSYHEPGTNRLVGLSSKYPDPKFRDDLWVKSLDFPVRKLGLKDEQGGDVLVLYDPREKDLPSAVIKAKERSWLANGAGLNGSETNGGVIETLHHVEDHVGFRLVIMEGGRPLRDKVTQEVENLFSEFTGNGEIKKKDSVKTSHGRSDRVQFRRRLISVEGLESPLEVMIFALEDYIASQYEVGEFDPESGIHNGPAYDLYKLKVVGNIAEYLWPVEIYDIDLAEAKREASFQYALRLGTKETKNLQAALRWFSDNYIN
ncbi:hypothetical protein HYT18_00895 [Candidatus Microgenomates bacterium]|nr:hypothetical protein [Candidatus Microgenomates bacterium]